MNSSLVDCKIHLSQSEVSQIHSHLRPLIFVFVYLFVCLYTILYSFIYLFLLSQFVFAVNTCLFVDLFSFCVAGTDHKIVVFSSDFNGTTSDVSLLYHSFMPQLSLVLSLRQVRPQTPPSHKEKRWTKSNFLGWHMLFRQCSLATFCDQSTQRGMDTWKEMNKFLLL